MTETLLNAIGEGTSKGGRARKGIVLIVVLSILMILAMMITVFVAFQRVELKVAGSFADDVRAKLLAVSGLEAVAQLANENGSAVAMQYWGRDDDEGGIADTDPVNVVIEDATNPSFALETDGDPTTGSVAPQILTVLSGGVTKQIGISGVMATGAYGINSDVFTVRVKDGSGGININDGLGHPYRQAVLERVLNRMGEELLTAPGPIPTLGTTIVTNRPPTGYTSVDEVAAFFTKPQFDLFYDKITVAAWQDPTTCNPVPLSEDDKDPYYVPTATFSDPVDGDPAIFAVRPTGSKGRYGRNYRSDGFLNTSLLKFFSGSPTLIDTATIRNSSVYGFDELNPRFVEICPRASVNMNTAPREVLIALFRDLEGMLCVEQRRPIGGYSPGVFHPVLYYDYNSTDPEWPMAKGSGAFGSGLDGTWNYVYTAGEIGVMFRTQPIDQSLARELAEEIIACRTKTKCGTVHGQYGTTYSHSEYLYDTAWYGGQFKSWQEFNMLIDLFAEDTSISNDNPPRIEKELLKDTRGNVEFYVYPIIPSNGMEVSSGSGAYTMYMTQARADTIKANFNPNTHLNELNPDLNIRLLVDKTDLIQPSFEFSFESNGTYEIESLGRVLKPRGGINAFTSTSIVAAEKKAAAIVRLFTPFRYTTQRDFYGDVGYGGVSGDNYAVLSNSADGRTYMNKALAIGPEVDQGAAPTENGYDGYVVLSTYGGTLPPGTYKTPKTVVRTSAHYVASTDASGETGPPGPGTETCMHAHFDLDFNLHGARGRKECMTDKTEGAPYSITGPAFDMSIGASTTAIMMEPPRAKLLWQPAADAPRVAGSGGYWNFHDRTETALIGPNGQHQSPYCPAYDNNGLGGSGGIGRRYWTASDYYYDPLAGPPPLPGAPRLPARLHTGTNPRFSSNTDFKLTAPSDQRIDGMFGDRSATPMWCPDADNKPETITNNNIDSRYGVVSYWLKIGFEPDLSGRYRIMFNVDAGGRGGWERGGLKAIAQWWASAGKGRYNEESMARVDYEKLGSGPNYDDYADADSYKNMLGQNFLFGSVFHRISGRSASIGKTTFGHEYPHNPELPPADYLTPGVNDPTLDFWGGPMTPHTFGGSTRLCHYLFDDGMGVGQGTKATAHKHELVQKSRQMAMTGMWMHVINTWLRDNNPTITDTRIYPELYQCLHGLVKGQGNPVDPTLPKYFEDPKVAYHIWVNGRKAMAHGGSGDAWYVNGGTRHQTVGLATNWRQAHGNHYSNVVYDMNGMMPDEQFHLWYTTYAASGVASQDSVLANMGNPVPINNILYRRQDPEFDPRRWRDDTHRMPLAQMAPISFGAVPYADTAGPFNTDHGTAASAGMWVRNYSSDTTVDEMYIWPHNPYNASGASPSPSEAIKRGWDKGRFYRMCDANGLVGYLESPRINPAIWTSSSAGARVLPTASVAAAPTPGTAGTVLPTAGGTGGSSAKRILAVAWTMAGDAPRDAAGILKEAKLADPKFSMLRTYAHLMQDFGPTKGDEPGVSAYDTPGDDPVPLDPEIGVRIGFYDPLTSTTAWNPPLVSPPYLNSLREEVGLDVPAGMQVKWRVEFWWKNRPAGFEITAVLLQSPVFDDITLYVQDVSYDSIRFPP